MPYSNVPAHLTGKMDRCVKKVMAQGNDKKTAIAICHNSVVKATKQGARHSRGDQEMLQAIHDAAVDLGAMCEMEKEAGMRAKDHSGAMVALFVPEESKSEILGYQAGLPRGAELVAKDELHLTICFLGEVDEINEIKSSLVARLAEEAIWQTGIVGTLTGYARFNTGEEEGGKDAIVLLVDSPQLPSLYQSVKGSTGYVGPYNHGFIPHITLGYIPAGTKMPQLDIPKSEIVFNDITLAWGDERTTLPMQPADMKSLPATFSVTKDAKGDYRWVLISSSAYQDQDGEIVSRKALQADVARADEEGDHGPLLWWHIPGAALGKADYNALHGRMLIESGTFASKAIAEKVAEQADSLGASLGFYHPADEPDQDGVFHTIRRFERSLLPRGKASNLFSSPISYFQPSAAIFWQSLHRLESPASCSVENTTSLSQVPARC